MGVFVGRIVGTRVGGLFGRLAGLSVGFLEGIEIGDLVGAVVTGDDVAVFVGAFVGVETGFGTFGDGAFVVFEGVTLGTIEAATGALDGATVITSARQLAASKNATQSKAQSVLFA